MSGFSNFAISFSIICILAGGITSFQAGLSSAGGAAIGIGWPIGCAFSLIVAASMGQIASAYPTAGGLYHWASILGGRGLGWAPAWFNLLGLIFVVSSVDVGVWTLFANLIGANYLGLDPATLIPDATKPMAEQISSTAYWVQAAAIAVILGSQALFNHIGIRATTLLTDFSGSLIFGLATLLTIAMVAYAPHIDLSRLVTFTNYTGDAGGGVWPATGSLAVAFLLVLLMPAYTVHAIWVGQILAFLSTLYTPAFLTLAAGCAVFLYISYAMPVAAGLLAEGKSWTKKGPFQLGVFSKPLAALTVLGAAILYVIGVQPPNDDLLTYTGGLLAIMTVLWFAVALRRFPV